MTDKGTIESLFQSGCQEITADMSIPGWAVGLWHAGNEQVAGVMESSKVEPDMPVRACLL
jgi:hypothetical protein